LWTSEIAKTNRDHSRPIKSTPCLVTEENGHLIPESDLQEWQAAMEEYRQLQAAGKFN
jgi:hypothetical protein